MAQRKCGLARGISQLAATSPNPAVLVLDFDHLDCPPLEDEVIQSVHHRFVFSYSNKLTANILKSQNVMGDRLFEIAYTEFPCD